MEPGAVPTNQFPDSSFAGLSSVYATILVRRLLVCRGSILGFCSCITAAFAVAVSSSRLQ